MQAYEFSLRLNHKGELIIPEEAVERLKEIGKARVILLFEETEELAWQHLSQDAFFKGYSEKDAAYDAL